MVCHFPWSVEVLRIRVFGSLWDEAKERRCFHRAAAGAAESPLRRHQELGHLREWLRKGVLCDLATESEALREAPTKVLTQRTFYVPKL